MADPIQISELVIVGYADSRAENMLPSIVPPVFRWKESIESILLPPFLITAGLVYGGTEVSFSRALEFSDSEQITFFDPPLSFETEFDHELWLDQSFHPCYEPRSQALANLRGIAAENIAEADKALRRGDLVRARRLSGIAACADDRRLEPFAIQFVIDRRNQNVSGQQRLARIADSMGRRRDFDQMVEKYSRTRGMSAAAALRPLIGMPHQSRPAA